MSHAKSVPHLYSQYLDNIQYLQLMSSQYPSLNLDCTHLYRPCPVSNTALHPMSRHYTISPTHVQSVHHCNSTYPDSSQYVKHMSSLSCLCQVRIPPLLPMTVQSEYHLSCLWPVDSTPFLLPIPSQYIIYTAHAVKIPCPCPVIHHLC